MAHGQFADLLDGRQVALVEVIAYASVEGRGLFRRLALPGAAANTAGASSRALLKARGEVSELARTAGQDLLIRAADRYATLREFAPLLLEVLDFKASRNSEQTLAAVQLLRGMDKSGERGVWVAVERKTDIRMLLSEFTTNPRLLTRLLKSPFLTDFRPNSHIISSVYLRATNPVL